MSAEEPVEEELAPYRIEGARSSRSKCKTCRRAIEKGTLRLGVLIEGPFGAGYLWHHLVCAARRRPEDVEAAYALSAWDKGVAVPPIEELRGLAEEAEKKRAEKKEAPYVERAPSGRSKCAQCGAPVEQGAFRVVVLRSVEFYNQVRSGPIKVHPGCVAAALAAPESATETEGFAEAVRANSGLADAEVERALAEIGKLAGG
jgi:Poly(ADP-ribose) polymerase and DNA-Ligase Zn-finger region